MVTPCIFGASGLIGLFITYGESFGPVSLSNHYSHFIYRGEFEAPFAAAVGSVRTCAYWECKPLHR